MESSFTLVAGPVTRNEWRHAAGLSLLCLTVLLAVTPRLTPDDPRFAPSADHHQYIFMAEHGAIGYHIAPFCWRIGVPALVRLMPGSVSFGFMLIACVGVWAAGVGMYGVARAFGHDGPTGVLATLLFYAMGWAARCAIFDFWLTDGAVFAIVVWAIFCAKRNRPIAFVALTCLGVLVKESVLFVTPLFAMIAPQTRGGAGPFVRRLALALPAAAVCFSIRTAIPAYNDDPHYVASLPSNLRAADGTIPAYDYVEMGRVIVAKRLLVFHRGWLHACTTEAFGIAPCLLCLLAPRRNLALLARMLPFVLAVYAQLLFATDTQRLVVLAFPVVLLMAVSGLEALSGRLRTSIASWVPLGILLFVALLLQPRRMSPGVVVQLIILFGYAAIITIAHRVAASRRR